MSSAFIREPDEYGEANCPVCESHGVLVGTETMDAHIKPEHRHEISTTGYFCPSATCDVAYFDVFRRRINTDALNGPVYPKDPQAPICPCFGLTLEDIKKDVAEGTVTRVKDVVLRARTPEARCAFTAADGQCCVQAVQLHFHKLKEQANS